FAPGRSPTPASRISGYTPQLRACRVRVVSPGHEGDDARDLGSGHRGATGPAIREGHLTRRRRRTPFRETDVGLIHSLGHEKGSGKVEGADSLRSLDLRIPGDHADDPLMLGVEGFMIHMSNCYQTTHRVAVKVL